MLWVICTFTRMLQYILPLAVERSARYFSWPTLLYCLHSYGVMLVLEFGDHQFLHFSKGELPAHPLLKDVHGWSLYVTVYTMTRVFWPSSQLSRPANVSHVPYTRALVSSTYASVRPRKLLYLPGYIYRDYMVSIHGCLKGRSWDFWAFTNLQWYASSYNLHTFIADFSWFVPIFV